MTFKIRHGEDYYSHGVIGSNYWDKDKKPTLGWSKKGKEWKTEKGVKDHLLKWITKGGSIEGWEVVEVVYHPTKPMSEWVDAKMLMKVLKNQ
jgi:hypothetical protein